MKKLIINLSIIFIILITCNVLTNKVFASSTDNSINQIQMKLTSVKQTKDNQTLLTFTDQQGNNWSCYGNEDKGNIDKYYTITMQGDRLIDYTLEYKYDEVITLVQSSIYNPLSNQYINSAKTEDDQIYNFYSDKSLYLSWQVLIIDTKGNSNIQDDEVINSFNLDDYTFNNDN